MAHQRRGQPGDSDQARRYFDEGLECLNRESAGNLDLLRLRDEAATLLGVPTEKAPVAPTVPAGTN